MFRQSGRYKIRAMPKSSERFIVLLRGINVSGANKVPMADLRTACTKDGMLDVATYIQSGNIVVSASGPTEAIEAQFEKLLEKKFKVTVPVIVRRASDWPAYIKGNPFPKESEDAPNAVMMALSKKKPEAKAIDQLRERATGEEKVAQAGDAIWIHFANGVADSKLFRNFDKLIGSPVTTRNWRTVLKLGEMVKE
jgi:uncharacterized protein (DUF1697 family)